MRESGYWETRLHRFDVWQLAVATGALLALAALAAWAAMLFRTEQVDRWVVVGVAAALAVTALACARSLVRVEAGVLACRDGVWSFCGDSGVVRGGPLVVAIDLGAFLLLRLGERRRTRLWLPVQRRGLEREWHALRCAVHASPAAASAPGASPFAPE